MVQRKLANPRESWTAVRLGARGHSVSLLALTVVLALTCPSGGEAAFNVSLELQGDCSARKLTLICRHSETGMAPLWIHNGTVERGEPLHTAFPDAVYTVQALTEHIATITGVDSVQALDGCVFQCVYDLLDSLTESNAVQFSFIPPDYQPALSLVSITADFSEHLSTFNYSYEESCGLYPRCTPYVSVEHTVSPQSAVSNSSSGCSVEYTIHNLMRCVSYQSNATTLISNQRGNPVVVGSTVMLSPGPFTITDVSIGADRDLINVTYMENEPDCPGYPTEWYTVDVDGVQVADLTADAVQSLAINHTNGSVTLSLPLSQPLPENAVTLNMTKYNTVPTNRSDITGNIVTEMVTWGTSAVFVFNPHQPPPTMAGTTVPPNADEEPQAPGNDDDAVVISVSVSVGILVLLTGGGGGTAVIVVVIKWRNKKKELGYTPACGHEETPSTDEHKWVKGTGRQSPMQPEEAQEAQEAGMHATEPRDDDATGSTSELLREIVRREGGRKAGRHAAQRQHYAELDFAEERPIPPPPSDLFVVAYAEVGQA